MDLFLRRRKMTSSIVITDPDAVSVQPFPTASLRDAFSYCENLTRSHYENFPVASLILPKRERPHICAVYAFARTADDFADEGDRTVEARLALLNDWQTKLDACIRGEADHPVFIALAETLRVYKVPKGLFNDLLTAFRMDVTTSRFETFDDLLFYCSHSANPVGRIVLHIFRDASPRNLSLSDAVCTALQLTNFWQDLGVDWPRGRLYLPLEDCRRFGYNENELTTGKTNSALQQLMKFQVERTRQLFDEGKPLCREAAPSLRLELKLTWHGGTTVLNKIETSGYDVLHRPTLSLKDKLQILVRSLVMS
ncbi:MAG: squalene synthase HpnC [Bacteroidota bacterium]